MLFQNEISQIFAKRNAIIRGSHFVYAKKPDGYYHGTEYVNKDAIYPYVDDVSALCHEIARRSLYQFGMQGIDVVVGPTVGAVSLAQWTTHWLHHIEGDDRILAVCSDEEDILEPMVWVSPTHIVSQRDEFSAIGNVQIRTDASGRAERIFYFAKTGTRRVIKRGYDVHVRGKRCLIVEDILNTGATVAKVRDAILELGGEPIGVGCLCNRSGGKIADGKYFCLPWLTSLLDVDMKMVKEDDCPTCRERGRGSVRLDLGKGKDFLARMGLKPGDK